MLETDAIYIERDTDRKIRHRNKLYYRVNHWPIWIFVFFIAPGPLTFDLFERGFDRRLMTWLAVVLVGTAMAGLRGRLPGCEPRQYTAGLLWALVTGMWRLKQMYAVAYFPIAGTIWLLGALGHLPRVKASTQGEGHERRYFYGSVWAVAIAHPILWLLWKVLPETRTGDALKLLAFVGILAAVAYMSRLGLLPRTRPIVPGELAVSD